MRARKDIPTVRLADVAELNPRLANRLSADTEVAFVPMAALSAETAKVTAEETRAYANVSKGYTPFTSGDVLLAKITPCFENGKIGQAILSKPIGFGSTEFHVIRPRPDKLDARYAHHFLRLDYIRTAGERRMTGSGGQRRVPEAYLAELSLPLPPLAEQRRIAEVLDRAEALRAKRRAALAELDTLIQSLFLDLFGDPATNPKGWPRITLGDALVAIRNGANAVQRAEPGGWPITRIETIADGTINPQRVRWIEPDQSLTDGFQLQPGDILFSHINSVEHIAKTALYSGEPTPLIHGINLLRLRPKFDLVEPVWLLYLLKHDVIRTHFRARCKRAVNQASLNQPDIKGLSTFLPTISLQREFASRVTAVEKLKAAQRALLTQLDALFASLQHRAFRGEL